ncbi:MAG: hypothetical protein CBC48_21430 [bacterium TMED88]|nr:hypothetical protein [Deltaproteobacteria bacterium]OUV19798.1 MAG: hypothetical protein CBC48_21430 [bacterium TMED88]
MRYTLKKLLILISVFGINSNISAIAETSPSLKNPSNRQEINFEYDSNNVIPSAMPKMPINEEARIQNNFTVEDLIKLASIDYENDWNILVEEVTRYQKELLKTKKSINLEQALELAIRNNPTLSANKYQVLGSIWRERAEMRRWLPSITLNSGNTGFYKEELYVNSRYPKDPNDGTGSVTSYSSDYYQSSPTATISWDLFDPERGPSIQIEKRNVERDKLLLNYSIRSLVVDIYNSYTNIEIILEEINAYSELVALEIAIADAIYEVYANQLTSIAEVAKWRAQTYTSITQLIKYYQLLDEAYSEFSSVIGSEDYFPVLPKNKKLYLGKWKLSLKESIEKGKRENERIKSEYINSEVSAITAQKFINSYLPTFTINASASNAIINGIYEASLFPDPILPTSTQNTTNPQYQIYAGMTLAFDGGINLARARAQKMDQKRSLFKTKELSNEVTQLVRNSYNGLTNESINYTSAEKSVVNSKISLDVYKQRFMAGLTDTTPFLQAVNLYTTAIIARSEVKKNLVIHYVNLLKSTATWPKQFETSLDTALESIMKRREDVPNFKKP